jgi:hypothetical protein
MRDCHTGTAKEPTGLSAAEFVAMDARMGSTSAKDTVSTSAKNKGTCG